MSNSEKPRPPFPPFNAETAATKARMAENAWNTKDPVKVSLAYTPDSQWRNRSTFLKGREQIVEFLTNKWANEIEYKLIKEVWAFTDNQIAVRFAYEWRNPSGQWFRSCGNENWQFDEHGFMAVRHASINDIAIEESERKFTWEGDQRPDNFPSLSELGL